MPAGARLKSGAVETITYNWLLLNTSNVGKWDQNIAVWVSDMFADQDHWKALGNRGYAMKRQFLTITAILLLAVTGIGSASADKGHYHGRVGVGVVVGPYWGPWHYPAPYYYPPYYYPPYYPPVVIERPAPPVYIEQSPPAETVAKSDYWYYCQSKGGYYPFVKECPDGWQKVLPRP